MAVTSRFATILFAIGINSASAQPVANFNNNVLSLPPDRLVRYLGTGVPLFGTNFMAVLLYGTSSDSLIPHTQYARFRAPVNPPHGTWSGGLRTLTGIDDIPGAEVTMRVDVFDIRQFSNYASAAAGGGILGSSAVFTYTVPTPPIGPAETDLVNFAGFYVIPEPTMLALVAAGALVLWMVKGRQRA